MRYRTKIQTAFIGAFFAIASVAIASASEEMVVKLSTDGVIIPVCLTGVDTSSSDFDAGYEKQLAAVLRFDLNHNGRTAVINDSREVQELAKGLSFEHANSPAPWKELGVDYVLAGRVRGQALDLLVFSTSADLERKMEGIKLTGDLAIDRRQVHQLADRVHQLLFGQDGVANTRILYTVVKENPDPRSSEKFISDVWETDYDGANARRVTRGEGYCVTPAWVPPPKGCASGHFFYVSYKTGQPKIYLASLFNGKGKRLSTLKGNQLMPMANRQLDHVAFINDTTGNPDLFLQKFDPKQGVLGKPRQLFSAYHATQGTPTFSPDGKKIAFVSNKDGNPRIYAMEIPEEGTPLSKIKPTLVTKRSRGSTAPNWSPDGSKIAYCSKIDGVRQIWVYDFKKQEERQITAGSPNKENPTWAPDSLHLVYNTNHPQSRELYIMDLNRLVPTRISRGGGFKRFPAWEVR